MSPRSPVSATARGLALVLGLFTLAALALQFRVSNSQPGMGDPLQTLWVMARYFTILTNLLVALAFLATALGRAPSDRWLAAVVLAIGLVGTVYHLLLAPLVDLQGLALWADIGLHSVTPAAAVLWWLAFGGRRLSPRDLPFWVLWPLVYCLYALIRGGLDGRYPYFFLDLGAQTPGFVATHILGITAGFLVAGGAMLLIARLGPRPQQA